MSVLKLSICPENISSYKAHDKVVNKCRTLMFFSGMDTILLGTPIVHNCDANEIYDFFTNVVLDRSSLEMRRQRYFRIASICS